ncbi:ATP-binding protein [Vibrio navarrensis]|uniref:ATP-binding protein n=1 Tax=Vibrio navarrensis TaxID=29495 RepID=UPI003857D35D
MQLERLCEPYFRADTLTEGNGLGLTISQRIVKAHGGELKLRLSMRGGLIATLSFPREML